MATVVVVVVVVVVLVVVVSDVEVVVGVPLSSVAPRVGATEPCADLVPLVVAVAAAHLLQLLHLFPNDMPPTPSSRISFPVPVPVNAQTVLHHCVVVVADFAVLVWTLTQPAADCCCLSLKLWFLEKALSRILLSNPWW